jgi:CubicO group peptidase (beta-lactamase class C family)
MFLNQGRLGTTRLLSEESIRLMTHNQIGDVVVSLQPAADPMRTRPFPLGAGADKFGLGFQIAVAQSTNPRMRSPGSYSWAGIDNTHFWVDPTRRIAVVMLMQVLPFYDDRAIQLLRGFEQLVNEQVR